MGRERGRIMVPVCVGGGERVGVCGGDDVSWVWGEVEIGGGLLLVESM